MLSELLDKKGILPDYFLDLEGPAQKKICTEENYDFSPSNFIDQELSWYKCVYKEWGKVHSEFTSLYRKAEQIEQTAEPQKAVTLTISNPFPVGSMHWAIDQMLNGAILTHQKHLDGDIWRRFTIDGDGDFCRAHDEDYDEDAGHDWTYEESTSLFGKDYTTGWFTWERPIEEEEDDD